MFCANDQTLATNITTSCLDFVAICICQFRVTLEIILLSPKMFLIVYYIHINIACTITSSKSMKFFPSGQKSKPTRIRQSIPLSHTHACSKALSGCRWTGRIQQTWMVDSSPVNFRAKSMPFGESSMATVKAMVRI